MYFRQFDWRELPITPELAIKLIEPNIKSSIDVRIPNSISPSIELGTVEPFHIAFYSAFDVLEAICNLQLVDDFSIACSQILSKAMTDSVAQVIDLMDTGNLKPSLVRTELRYLVEETVSEQHLTLDRNACQRLGQVAWDNWMVLRNDILLRMLPSGRAEVSQD